MDKKVWEFKWTELLRTQWSCPFVPTQELFATAVSLQTCTLPHPVNRLSLARYANKFFFYVSKVCVNKKTKIVEYTNSVQVCCWLFRCFLSKRHNDIASVVNSGYVHYEYRSFKLLVLILLGTRSWGKDLDNSIWYLVVPICNFSAYLALDWRCSLLYGQL